jgi:hypothetical protein
MKAVDSSVTLDEGVAQIFTQYANALAEQGLLVTAAKYCRYVASVDIVWIFLSSRFCLSHVCSTTMISRGTSPDSKILRDRLYRSRESPACLAALGSAPEFPFTLTQVNKAPARSAATSQGNQRRQPQSYTNQQAASQNSSKPQGQTAYGTQQQVQPVRFDCYFIRGADDELLTHHDAFLLFIVRPLLTRLCPTDGSRYKIQLVARPITLIKPPDSRRGRCLSQLLLHRLRLRRCGLNQATRA